MNTTVETKKTKKVVDLHKTDDIIAEVQQNAEKIANDGDHFPSMEVYDEWRQGDVRIIRLPDNFVKEYVNDLKEVSFNAQVAPGTTRGSRHEINTTGGVKMYKLANGNAVDGPIIEADDPVTITHPEHGNVCNLPAGCYAFPGQRTFAEELKRTRD